MSQNQPLFINPYNNHNYYTNPTTPATSDPFGYNDPATTDELVKQRMDYQGHNVLFVSGFPNTQAITKEVLFTVFSKYGTVINVDLIQEEGQRNNNTQIIKSYAFVSMQTESQCNKVLKATVNNKLIIPVISPTNPINVDFFHSSHNNGLGDISVHNNNVLDSVFGPTNRLLTDVQQLTQF